MPPELAHLLPWLAEYRYWLIFALTIIEGPVIMTFGGFLLKLGYFSFWPLYLVLMLGDLAADALWYGVGYWGGHPFVRRYGRWFSISDAAVAKMENAFHDHQGKILFLSKITMGFGFALAILVAAGTTRVPFRRYISLNAAGQVLWTGLLMGLGYFFGNLYLVVNESLRIMAVVAFVVVLFAILMGVGRYLRTRET